MEKKAIKIKSSLGADFNSEVDIRGEKYFIQTEEGGSKSSRKTTRVYLNGRIIYSKETDSGHGMDAPLERVKTVRELMQKQHQLAIGILKAEKTTGETTVSDYLEEVKALLGSNKEENALRVLTEALENYSDNPFLLSYYGYLKAAVKKSYKEGIRACTRALETLKQKVPFGEEFFYPVLYLNLGKAYLAAGRKKKAVDAFQKGLEMDSENSELRKMLSKVGARRRPAIPFFERSHVLNKYIGMLSHKFKKR
ncbi:MAG: tetratricopeptide repeat protein [Thermodesulfovibrionales bacterium]